MQRYASHSEKALHFSFFKVLEFGFSTLLGGLLMIFLSSEGACRAV